MKKLELFRKLAERISYEYEINWDQWNETLTKELSDEVTTSITEYEQMFQEIDEKNKEVDDEVYEFIIESLISNYTISSILERKHKIEEIILAKV